MPSIKSFAEDEQYAMLHKQFVLTEEAYRSLHLIDPWLINATPLLHPDTPLAPDARALSEEEHVMLSHHYILVHWLLPFLMSIGEIAAADAVSAREFLEMIKGTTYQYREYHHAGLTPTASDPRLPVFQHLRESWFSLDGAAQEQGIAEAYAAFQTSVSELLGIARAFFDASMTTMPLPSRHPPRHPLHRLLLRAYPRSVILDTGTHVFVYQTGRTAVEIDARLFRSPLGRTRYAKTVFLLPLSLCAVQNMHLCGEGLVCDRYRRCLVTDLEQVPLFTHPILQRLLTLRERTVRQTQHVAGVKQPFYTYGLGVNVNTRTLRVRLGGWYDDRVESCIGTPIGSLLQISAARLVLPSA